MGGQCSRRPACPPSGNGRRTILFVRTKCSKPDPSNACRVLRRTYLSTKAVPNATDLLNSQLLAEVLDGGLDDGVDMGGLVVLEPGREVGLAVLEVVELDGVALEEVGDDGQVALGGEVVGDELAVGVDADDVGQDDDGLLGGLVVLGVGEVGLDWRGENRELVTENKDISAYISWIEDSMEQSIVTLDLPFPMVLISPEGLPSCLKPVAQQAAGGLDAMVKKLLIC